MTRSGDELLESLADALAHAKETPSGVVAHQVPAPDVRAIRRRLHMSQQQFASAYHIPLPTLKNWEQGRRQPDAPAAAYLQVIARNPDAAREALSSE